LVFLDGEAPLEELESFLKCGKEVNRGGSRVACFRGFFHEGGQDLSRVAEPVSCRLDEVEIVGEGRT
jgi:hypothetical protein